MADSADVPDPVPGSPEMIVDAPLEGAPSDNTTLVDVLATWNERGFSGQLVGLDGGRIECIECGSVTDAGLFDVVQWRRLEGASDPADMVKAIAAHCPECGSGGNLVLGYGVNASEIDEQIAAALGVTGDTSVQTPDRRPDSVWSIRDQGGQPTHEAKDRQ